MSGPVEDPPLFESPLIDPPLFVSPLNSVAAASVSTLSAAPIPQPISNSLADAFLSSIGAQQGLQMRKGGRSALDGAPADLGNSPLKSSNAQTQNNSDSGLAELSESLIPAEQNSSEFVFRKSNSSDSARPSTTQRFDRQLSFSVGQRAISGYEHAGEADDEEDEELRLRGIEEEESESLTVPIHLQLSGRHLPSKTNLIALFEQTSNQKELQFLGHTELFTNENNPNFQTHLHVLLNKTARIHNIKLNLYSFDELIDSGSSSGSISAIPKLSEKYRIGSVFVSLKDIQENLNEELVVEVLHGVDQLKDNQLSELNSHLVILARTELTIQQKSLMAIKMGKIFHWWRGDGIKRTVFFFWKKPNSDEANAEDLGSIHWNYEEDDFDDSMPDRTIELSSISAIYEGKQTPAFLLNERAKAEVSFSIVFTNNSSTQHNNSADGELIMDLESDTLEDRQLFLLGLHAILTGSANENASGGNNSTNGGSLDNELEAEEKPRDDSNVFHFTVGARNLPQQFTQSSGLSATISTRAQSDTYTVVGKTGWIQSSPFPDFPLAMNVRHVHVGQTLKFDLFYDNYKISIGTAIVKFIDLREHLNEIVMVQLRNVREMEKDRELNQSNSAILITINEGRAEGNDEIVELDEDVEEAEEEYEESVNSQLNHSTIRRADQHRRNNSTTLRGDTNNSEECSEGSNQVEAEKPPSKLALDRGYQIDENNSKPPISPSLFDGLVLKKHAVGKGKVEDKLIFIDLSMGFGVLFWTKPVKSANSAPAVDNNRSIPLQTIKDIYTGKMNSVFQRKGMERIDGDCCFSIISNKRSLDLECQSKSQRDFIVKDLINMMLPKSKNFKCFGVGGSGVIEEKIVKNNKRKSNSSVKSEEINHNSTTNNNEISPPVSPAAEPAGLAEALKFMKKLKDKGLIVGDGIGDNEAQLDELLGELGSKFSLGPAALDEHAETSKDSEDKKPEEKAAEQTQQPTEETPSAQENSSAPPDAPPFGDDSIPTAPSFGISIPDAPGLILDAPPSSEIPSAPSMDNSIPIPPPLDSSVPPAPDMIPSAPGMDSSIPCAPGFGAPPPPSFSMSKPVPKLDPNRKRLKQLHWDALADAEVAGSFWSQIPVAKDDLISDQSHISEIDALFLQKPVDFKRKPTAAAQSDEEKFVSLLDSKRIQNVEIGLRRVGMSHEALIRALRTMDEQKMTDDVLSLVQPRLPQMDELTKIKSYKGPLEKLGNVEKFFLMCTEIPRLEMRIDLQLFTIRFPNQALELKKKLKIVFSAGKAVEDSENLKRVLGIVLHTGNYLNAGTKNGSAVGFRLQTLNKLTSTKSNDNKLTLLDFIVLTVHKKYNSSANTGFLFDLNCVKEAALLDWNNILEDHKRMKSTIQRMQTIIGEYESGKLAACGADDSFQKFLNDEYSKCFQSIKLLSKKIKRITQLEEELLQHFGESKANSGLNQLFEIFAQFVRDYERSETEFQTKLKAKLKKEAQLKAAEGNSAAIRMSGENIDAAGNGKIGSAGAKSPEARKAALERARKKRAEAHMNPIDEGVKSGGGEEEGESNEFASVMEKARKRRENNSIAVANNKTEEKKSAFNSMEDQ